MKWLNYHHLYYFRTIAKEGSISKASEKLLVGQPALSTQLKQLEESLGVLLFERKNRSMNLTEAGRMALDYAEEIFQRGEDFLEAFEGKKFRSTAGFRPRFRLGAIAGLPKSLVCSAIKLVKSMEPGCFVSTFEAENEFLSQMLFGRELDLALTNDPGRAVAEVYRHKAGEASIKVYGAPKYSGLKRKFPSSLDNCPFILQTVHSKIRHDIEQRFLTLGISYELFAECQDYGVKKGLAKSGEGLVFLPEFAARGMVERGELIEIGGFEGLVEEYWLLCQNKQVKTYLIGEFLRSFRIGQ